MRRILITGMSGVGKSTVVDELRSRGYLAVDLDAPQWSTYDDSDPTTDREWIWREDRVLQLLTEHDDGTLFVSGCSSNQRRFYSLFDRVVLLTAPEAITRDRLAQRTNNDFGKTQAELDKVLDDKASFEERLEASAHLVIDTEAPLDQVVQRIVEASLYVPARPPDSSP